MSVRLTITVTDETNDELRGMADRFGVTFSQLGSMCIRAGLDVLKLATSSDYQALMEVMGQSEEYKLAERISIEKKSRGTPPSRDVPGGET